MGDIFLLSMFNIVIVKSWSLTTPSQSSDVQVEASYRTANVWSAMLVFLLATRGPCEEAYHPLIQPI